MAAARRPEPPTSAEAETSASHAVMELVRTSSVLSLLVVQLRDAGKSWREVRQRSRPRFLSRAQLNNDKRNTCLYPAGRFDPPGQVPAASERAGRGDLAGFAISIAYRHRLRCEGRAAWDRAHRSDGIASTGQPDICLAAVSATWSQSMSGLVPG